MSDSLNFACFGSLLPEKYDVEPFIKALNEIGWKDAKAYGLEENQLLENIIYDKLFDELFEKINEHELRDLTHAERREVLNQVKDLLRNASEETILDYLKYGVSITVKREKRTFTLIDHQHLENNLFTYAHEAKFPGSPENIKPDITLMVNGIPIAIVEIEPTTRIGSTDIGVDQVKTYEQKSPNSFRFIQLAIIYGDKRVFIPTLPNWEKKPRFSPTQNWKVKKVINGKTTYEENIHHLIQPDTLLKLIRWYTFFRDKKGEKDKIIARYNQFWATEESFERAYKYLNGQEDKKNGLIWHWQGSGKTYTMFFTANRFFEIFFHRNPVIFFIIDRRELQRQLKNFVEGLKAHRFKDYLKKINNVDELLEVIEGIKRSEYQTGIIPKGIYIVLIQKFRRKDFEDLLERMGREYLSYLRQTKPEEYEQIAKMLKELPPDEERIKLIEIGGIWKKEILLLIDEAHRSQYGLLASVMKNVFTSAIRLAFTGTPVFKFEKNTFIEFSYPPDEYYLDVYFVKESISDGFTLPIAYDVVQEGEPLFEGIKILLNEEEVKNYIKDWFEASEEEGGSAADDFEALLDAEDYKEVDVAQPLISKREITQRLDTVKTILVNERRLEKLAEYIANRIEDDTEGFKFKAMVVAANRKACVILKRYLDEKLAAIYGPGYGEEVNKWTEVVMTYQQNDKDEILRYKEELIKRRGKRDTDEINQDIQTEFKEKENPKILVVTDMLITGFDAPQLKVMYLDKPLYEHRLLQAIARVNRPYEDKVVRKTLGLVVDSVGLLRHLRDSIKEYQLIAQGDIASDLEENVLSKIEEKFDEFKQTLINTKHTLKNLIVENRNFNIDIDYVKTLIKINKKNAREVLTEIDTKLRTLTVFWDNIEVQKALNLMHQTIQQYKAFGSHRAKMYYAADVEIITYIYGKLVSYINELLGRKLPNEFWEGLLRLIQEKTLVDDFSPIKRTVIGQEEMTKILKGLEQVKASQLLTKETEVADAYRIVMLSLAEHLINPVYREILERVERARKNWIERNIGLGEFIRTIASSIGDKLRYDERISGMDVEEQLTETVKTSIIQRFGIESHKIQLSNFRITLSKVIKTPRIIQTHKNDIRTALMKDLFKELKGKASTNELMQESEKLADYVINEIITTKSGK